MTVSYEHTYRCAGSRTGRRVDQSDGASQSGECERSELRSVSGGTDDSQSRDSHSQ